MRTHPDIYYSGQLGYLCVDSLSQDPAQVMHAAAFSKIHIFAGKNSQFITFLQAKRCLCYTFCELIIGLLVFYIAPPRHKTVQQIRRLISQPTSQTPPTPANQSQTRAIFCLVITPPLVTVDKLDLLA